MRFIPFIVLLSFSCTQSAKESVTADPAELSPTEASAPSGEIEAPNDSSAARDRETASSEKTGPIVYVTREGDKYHTADCRYSKTAHEVNLSQAKAQGKTACGICKPSSKTGEQQVRCSANTLEGNRCQRMTADASGKCFQHRGD